MLFLQPCAHPLTMNVKNEVLTPLQTQLWQSLLRELLVFPDEATLLSKMTLEHLKWRDSAGKETRAFPHFSLVFLSAVIPMWNIIQSTLQTNELFPVKLKVECEYYK